MSKNANGGYTSSFQIFLNQHKLAGSKKTIKSATSIRSTVPSEPVPSQPETTEFIAPLQPARVNKPEIVSSNGQNKPRLVRPRSLSESSLAPKNSNASPNVIGSSPKTKVERVQTIFELLESGGIRSEKLKAKRLGGALCTEIAQRELEGLKFLLVNRADPNGSEKNPVTPLFMATDLELTDYCRELLAANASLVHPNTSDGQCALQLALTSKPGVAQLFLQEVENLQANFNPEDIPTLGNKRTRQTPQ
jgi:hypothetical protein